MVTKAMEDVMLIKVFVFCPPSHAQPGPRNGQY